MNFVIDDESPIFVFKHVKVFEIHVSRTSPCHDLVRGNGDGLDFLDLTRVRAARFVVDVLRADGDARAFELRFRKVQPVSRSLSHLAVTSRKRVKDDESV